MLAASPTADRTAAPRGFTLTELMVTLTIIAAMTAMSVPSFQRAMEQSRADIAAANLRAIWAAQRLYWLENHAYTSDLTQLETLGLLDPQLPIGAAQATYERGGYGYQIDADPPPTATTFTARAAHMENSKWSGAFVISANGAITGEITASGCASISPGFQ